MASLTRLLTSATLLAASAASPLFPRQEENGADLSKCPGYKASNVQKSDTGLTADLTLAGEACGVYGDDVRELRLGVEYQTGVPPFTRDEDGCLCLRNEC